ncbi:MAG TPA: hypothetical protein VKE24_03640 [Candidatus Acidoferrales bacterium]|nr:hypothetical protein [Candidatus Acidoferrales bacterium]
MAKAKEEVRKILVVAVFFSTGFCLIHVSNRLLTEGSQVELASLTRAIFGGLIVAKVLLAVDILPFVHAFPGKPLALNIGWKTSLYVAGSVIFLYIEPFLKHLFRGAGLFVSHSRAWQELMLPRTWATVIWLAMLMAVFVTLKELSRVIGKDQLKYMFFGHRGKRVTQGRSRDAA